MIAREAQVTALIVNHNGGDRILRVLEALDRQRFPLAAIIVVDNASDDGSPDRISALHPHVQLLDMGCNAGLSAARNAGLAAAKTPYALMLDHDIYVEGGCIETLAEAQARSRAAVVCPRIRLIPERDVVQADGAAPHFLGTMILLNDYRRLAETPPESSETEGCIGACMFVDRAKVIEAGGFDPLIFFYLEDHEFSLRMRSLGHRFWCEATAEVFHERGSGTPGLSYRGNGGYPVRRAYFTMRHRLLTMLVHYRLRTLIILAPALTLYEIASVVAAIRKGWLRQWFRAWGWQFRNWSSIADRRRRMQRLRQRDDRELLVGGAIPLASGFLESSIETRLARMLGGVLEGYWRLSKRWIG
jgi:GT2 family glycosyltransferase